MPIYYICTLSATLGLKKCHSIPIACMDSPPIGMGTYRLPIDLKPIVQGVFYRIAPWHYIASLRRHGENNGGRLAPCRGQHRWETVVHIHQAATRNVDADWLLLAKLTPNMTARLMGRGCHGIKGGSLSRTSWQPRF